MIDHDRFLEWAESRFDNVVISGSEIKLNSIFCDDRKHHLWCNPDGGKTESELGVYHCWKTDKKGNLVGLVMKVEQCSYDRALEILDIGGSSGLAELEQKVNDIFNKKEKVVKEELEKKDHLELPIDCYNFEDLPSCHRLRKEAADYLEKRKLSNEGLLICTGGRYRNRILIPYYDRNKNLIYYNGRYIGDPGQYSRYLGPPKELGISKGDVLYSKNWFSAKEKVYITEGEFDSISLDICGFKSVALGGKNISENQINMLKGSIPVLCLDADIHGGKALPQMAMKLIQNGFLEVRYVRSSEEHKDWNKMLVNCGIEIIKKYIFKEEKEYELIAGANWEGLKFDFNEIFH